MFKLLHLGVARRLLEMNKKKMSVEEKNFPVVLQYVKMGKKKLGSIGK